MRTRLSIELSTTWSLWPLWHWDFDYHWWQHCDLCGDGHDMRRRLRVHVYLPFAQLTISPSYAFKTLAAIRGCPVKREHEELAAF